MNEMIAYCGLDCLQCGAFLATRSNDDAKRQEVAALWSKEYGGDFQPEDINCDGCLAESGLLFRHCEVCEIRKCGKEKGLANCAYCPNYPCAKLTEFFVVVPEANTRLDSINSSL